MCFHIVRLHISDEKQIFVQTILKLNKVNTQGILDAHGTSLYTHAIGANDSLLVNCTEVFHLPAIE